MYRDLRICTYVCVCVCIHIYAFPDSFALKLITALPLWLSWQKICLQCWRPVFNPWVGKVPWRREWLPTPVFWPGEFHGLENSMDLFMHVYVHGMLYSPWNDLCIYMSMECYTVIYRRRQWHPIPVRLPGKYHGWRSLVGCSPWGC